MLIITAPGQGAQTPGFLAPWLELPGVAERLGTASELAGLDLIRYGTTESGLDVSNPVDDPRGDTVGMPLPGVQAKNILFFLAAFEKVLLERGYRVSPGAGVAAAIQHYLMAEAVTAAVHRSTNANAS